MNSPLAENRNVFKLRQSVGEYLANSALVVAARRENDKSRKWCYSGSADELLSILYVFLFWLNDNKKKIITVLRLFARMAANYLVVTGVFTAATCTRLGRVQTERAELMVRSTAQDRGTESIRPMEAAQLTVDPPGTLDGIGYLGVRLFLIAAT